MSSLRLKNWSPELAVLQCCLTGMILFQIFSERPGMYFWIVSATGFGSFAGFFIRQKGYLRPADQVTFLRIFLVLILTAFFGADGQPSVEKVVLASLAFILDGVDGMIARRTQTTESGALFDMEADNWSVFSLCLICYQNPATGAFILIPGLLRPVLVLVTGLLQWRGYTLPSQKCGRVSAKLIYVFMVLSLILALTPGFPAFLLNPILFTGTLLLCFSFVPDFFRLIAFKKQQSLAYRQRANWSERSLRRPPR